MNDNTNVIKENRKVGYYAIIGIVALAIVCVGLTYAYWILTRQQEGVNTVNTACLSFKIINEKDEIDLPSAYPISNEAGLNLKPFKFTIENKCSRKAEFSINMEMLSDTTLSSDYVKMALNEENKIANPVTLSLLDQYSEMKISGTKEGRYILSDVLESNGSKNYELRIWLSSDVTPDSDANNKLFKSKIVVDGKIELPMSTEIEECVSDPQSNKCILLKNDKAKSLLYDNTADKNLRYTGVTPNNYVKFNDEIWRIIGILKVTDDNDEKVERLKIVRQDGIEGQVDFGNYSIDNNPYSSDSYNYVGTGDWTTSQLKDMLNGIYYNSDTGNCYKGSSEPETCDFSTTGELLPPGLNQTARNMIDADVKWNIGIANISALSTVYSQERSHSVFQAFWSKENDTSNHNGVGLIYPSDYGYAVGGSVRSGCINNEKVSDFDSNGCGNNSWLKPENNIQWTISPSNGTACNNHEDCKWQHFYVNTSGKVYYMNYANESRGVWPTVYLKENVKIVANETHDGSLEKPYELTLN